MTRKEAHRLVKTFNGPVAWTATCPYCKDCMRVLRKSLLEAPITWGQRTKVIAEIAEHIITNHPGRKTT